MAVDIFPTCKLEESMQLVVTPGGTIRCLYEEAVDLTALGRLLIRRASRVEPDEGGRWTADLGPVAGPRLGPFALRSQALLAEQQWLESHWLLSPTDAV
jgi:hypothetical protein